jgi:FKBP-type peptidyl-prolyl cis-trans isomerase FkpA
MKTNLILLACVLLFSTCKKKNTDSQATIDEKAIQKYISDNKVGATITTASGLHYVITTQGTGATPVSSSAVTVVYDGFLVDGSLFDQSPASGTSFNLSGVIKGWQEGLTYFKKGGKGTLLIPSALGYGPQGSGSIPANAVLIFNLQLVDVR